MRFPWALRIGLAGAALVALGLAVYWVVRAPHIRTLAHERIDRDLIGAAHALAAGTGPAGLVAPDLDARVKEGGRRAHLRFTIVGEDGRVLADSDAKNPAQLSNHAGRPEVREALEKGEALSTRVSESVNQDLRYAAVRIDGTRAVARAALSSAVVSTLVAEETKLPWAAGAAAAILAGFAAAFLLRPTTATVRAVANALSGIAGGDLSARVPVRGPDFLRGLSSAFNATAERLEADVARVSTERGRLSTVLDGMAEGVFAIDGTETIRFVNRAGRALLDVAPGDEVEGKPIHLLVRDPQFLKLARAAVERGEAHEAEIVWEGAPKRLLRVRAAPVREAGPGAILLVGDVSTIRRLERMRSDFVANVSHELRTPLAAIAGAAETLADGALSDPEAGPQFVAVIGRHADRLRALVDDLLTLSRLESSPENIERVPVDFAHVVRQACDAVSARTRDAGLALEVSADDAVRVMGDPEALRRLVDNLVVNAVTYTPSGGAVRVSLAATAGRAVLVVADSGIGIGAEHLDRIFERFYRIDKARSRSKGGTGLGLSIVKHAVNLHGGDIAVESRPGAGSTFTVSIPLARDGEGPDVADIPPEPAR